MKFVKCCHVPPFRIVAGEEGLTKTAAKLGIFNRLSAELNMGISLRCRAYIGCSLDK